MERRSSQLEEGPKLLSMSQNTCGNNQAQGQAAEELPGPSSSFWPGWQEGLALT